VSLLIAVNAIDFKVVSVKTRVPLTVTVPSVDFSSNSLASTVADIVRV